MHARRTIAAMTLISAVAVLVGLPATPAAAAGEVIVYETYGYYGGPADIHSVSPDGTGDVNLTPGTDASMELDPSVSADGTRIAFVSNRVTNTNPDGNFEVFTMGIDGSGVTQVTSSADPFGQGDYQSFNPTWSPDGTRIAFDGTRASYSASQIFVINADGTGERQVTSAADQASKWRPDWSPDGARILFTWGWDYYSQDVRTINPDGTGEENLTPDSVNSAQGMAVWSPDGRRIAFSADGTLAGQYPNPNREIFVMEYPSRVITQVTHHEATDEDPAWSADGTQITFGSPRDGKWALWVIAAPSPPAVAGATQPAAPGTAKTAGTAGAEAEAPVRKLDPGRGNEADPFWTSSGSTGGTVRVLTVTRKGRGRVTSSPAGISCGADCTEGYANGTVVKLTAKPARGQRLSGWSGACTGSATTCTVTMTAARSVTATFVRA